MKKIIIFDEDEYKEIREAIVEFKGDIWDIEDSGNRAVMFHDLNKLEDLLGIWKE